MTPIRGKMPILIIATLLLLLLGWRVLSLGLADHFARSQPERALFWRSQHPEALFRLAEQQAAEKKWSFAERNATLALQANRLDGRALRVLAQVAEAKGQPALALKRYQQAVKLSPRDLPSQAWLFQNALQRQDAVAAVTHLDALLRLQPALLVNLQNQAEILAVNDITRPELIKVLLKSPPWRAGFIQGLGASTLSTDALSPLFEGLGRRAEMGPNEINPWLERLRRENRTPQAYLTWANLLPEAQRKRLGNVFDGGFEMAPEEHNGPFAWRSGSPNGSLVLWTETRGTVGESSYSVQFEGVRTPFSDLSQSLVLPPGAWHLQWRAKAENLDNPRGMIWRINCEPDGRILAESEPMKGRFDWQDLEQPFTVPAECTGQTLTLMIPARIPAETLINGTLWLDEVRIQPAPELL